ncbi:11724_t:CDS:2 [Dentiscutata erythropus]|uniref:11724_t:CDS:1 n=1 Tax=Dentiscutata erythropus TaxID=1348616 RepID=A0A9N9JNG3_9GLOM|nr:11724_t:CDS:2 [Dentiscutata erythropus]
MQLTKAFKVKTYFTSLTKVSYKNEILVLEEQIEALKNYKELQHTFKTLINENKILKVKKFEDFIKINELKNKLSNQNRPVSKSKVDDILQKKNELFEKHIRNFIDILNNKTLHTEPLIEQKNKKELTKFVSKKKSDLIQIATSHKEELELLDAEVKYVFDTLRKDIEDKMNLDFDLEINFKSKKLNLEKQINKLEKNDDFKMLQKIINELIEENEILKRLNHKNLGNIMNLNKQIYSRNFTKMKDSLKESLREESLRESKKNIQDLKLSIKNFKSASKSNSKGNSKG